MTDGFKMGYDVVMGIFTALCVIVAVIGVAFFLFHYDWNGLFKKIFTLKTLGWAVAIFGLLIVMVKVWQGVRGGERQYE